MIYNRELETLMARRARRVRRQLWMHAAAATYAGHDGSNAVFVVDPLFKIMRVAGS